MLDIKEPVNFSLLVIVISFLLSVFTLYCSKPSWVLVVSSKENETVVSSCLVVFYSATFAIVCGIGALLFSTKERGPIVESVKRTPSTMFPSQQLVSLYKNK